MRERDRYLSEREIFILDNHPAMSYRTIADELGIGAERVRQIKNAAERKVREAKRKEQAAERNKLSVTFTVRRKDLFIILRGLEQHRLTLLQGCADQRRKKEPGNEDPDFKRTEELIDIIRSYLISDEDAPSLEIYPGLEVTV